MKNLFQIEQIQESSFIVFCGIFIVVSFVRVFIWLLTKEITEYLKNKKIKKNIETNSLTKVLYKLFL